MDQHRVQEERSIAYHRALSQKIAQDPALLDQVRARLSEWQAEGKLHRTYALAWRRLLDLPPQEIHQKLVDPGEEMRALRQCTPFVGILTPQERWAIWRRTRPQK